MMEGIFTPAIVASSVIISVLFAVCFMFIFSKAGYSKWRGLLMLIPIVNLIIFLMFAFSKWPILTGQQKVSRATGIPHQRQPGAGRPQETIPTNCPQCGTPFAANDKFCGVCGFPRQK